MRTRSHVACAFTSIMVRLHYTSPIISLVVADASSSSSSASCHELPCLNSDGSHGITNMNSNNNDSNNKKRNPPRRNRASPVIEEYYKNEVKQRLLNKRTEIENSVFLSYDSEGYVYQSTAYSFDDFLKALYPISVEGVGDVKNPIRFYVGQTDKQNIVKGLVNLAAFLAHAMAVSIKYDVCDEFNIDATDAASQKYAVSNACGQWGNSYQDEGVCVGGSEEVEVATCNVDPYMEITAADSLGWEKAAPPLECRPRESQGDFTGHWDAELGVLNEIYPYANRLGVLHNEGCCWWGRGVLMTRGTCSFGKLNYYLGQQAAAQGFVSFYAIDFCTYPEVVCEGPNTLGLRWTVGYFEWADRVQTYRNTLEGLDYMEDLNTFVESGFIDVNRFIDVVGKALPFGCGEESCLAAEERVTQERRDNFINLVFNVFDLPNLIGVTPFPSPPPTNQPTTSPPTLLPTRLITVPPTKRPSRSPTKFPTPKPTAQQTPPPTSKPIIGPLCSGQGSTFIPLNQCREYVQCVNGFPVGQLSCSPGLLFDPNINGCNWESSVTCTAPTKMPTPQPTQQQTPEPTPTPTQRRPKSTEQPFSNLQLPLPPPTFPPSVKSAPNEESNNPNSSQEPTWEGTGLITLPSGASLGWWGNSLFSLRLLCMAVVGAFAFLS